MNRFDTDDISFAARIRGATAERPQGRDGGATAAFALCGECVRRGERITCPMCNGWGVLHWTGRTYARIARGWPRGIQERQNAQGVIASLQAWATSILGPESPVVEERSFMELISLISRWIGDCDDSDADAFAYVVHRCGEATGPAFTPFGRGYRLMKRM